MLYLFLQKKKCKNCHRLTHKDVLYCWFCGYSFDHRICVSGHKNPRWVQYCLTCGKDRSLMSRPHSSHELSFVKHPTKPSTYVPRRAKLDHALAWLAVGLGSAILWYMAFLISRSL
jgi:RNA polymerase subunit RPABC4/transcription elongation factor Spt4